MLCRGEDLCDLLIARVTGWELCDLCDLAHDSGLGSALYMQTPHSIF